MPSIDVLLHARHTNTLPLALSGIAGQNLTCFRLIVADARSAAPDDDDVLQSIQTIVQARCGTVDWQTVASTIGQACVYDELLSLSTADLVLFLDDDVWLAPHALAGLVEAISSDDVGFVGAQPLEIHGEPGENIPADLIEYWHGPVVPDPLTTDDERWQQRVQLSCLNLYQLGQQINPGEQRKFKVAWMEKCCLYDRYKLLEVGGFQFGHRLPVDHAGAHLIPQNLILHRWGGCGLLPAGVYRIGGTPERPSQPSEDVVALLNRALSGNPETQPALTPAPA